MRNIGSLGVRFDVHKARAELAASDAWNRYRWRTEHPRSPHREASDIWIRYNTIENFGPRFNEEHEAVWYPTGLAAVRVLAEEMHEHIGGVLGGVLVTKIPAGKQVYPHVDRGWHAENFEKFAILLEGNEEQAFCYDDGAYRCTAGDAFTFNNQACHWVKNSTSEDRQTLIVCIRRAH